MQVTFHGVRGSTPCHGSETARYGGNTSCVAVRTPGQRRPILLDLGTGARYFGLAWQDGGGFDGVCLLSHLHWDHVQGLPFFPPILCAGSRLEIVAPSPSSGRPLSDEVRAAIHPPLFPVGIDDLPGEITFREVGESEFEIDDVRVVSRFVPHIGATVGYRLEAGGVSIAYISDHQQPGVDTYETTAGVRELCDGVDLLIHDAQYTRAEFARRPDWGHCTVEYACWVAEEAGARRLALYHHDPLHHDDMIDELVAANAAATGVDVFAAAEGMVVDVVAEMMER